MRLELKTLPVIYEERHGTDLARFYDAYTSYRSIDGVYIVVLRLFRYPGLSRRMYEN